MNTTPDTEQRRDRYADAILAALARDTSRGPNWHAAADAAIAVADKEREKDIAQWGADLEAADAENARLRTQAAEVRAAVLTEAADAVATHTGNPIDANAQMLRRMAAAARPDTTRGA